MTPDPHLDDETISATLDGEPIGDSARAHLDGCPACRARLESFRAVADAVRTPVEPRPSHVRDAAIAAALDAASEPARTAEARRRNFRPVLAVAAVVLLFLVAVPLISALSDGGDGNETAATGRDKTSTEQATGSLPDLGPLDADNLAGVVGERVTGTARQAPAPAPSAAAGDSRTSAGEQPMAAEARPGGSASASGGTGASTLTADQARACEATLNAEGTQVLAASGTWEGQPTVVIAYRNGDDIIAYVVSPQDCRILHFVRFRARS